MQKEFWEDRWKTGETGWDMGTVSTPLKEYIDQLKNKELRILIPGCGNAYEGQYLHNLGFTNVSLIDISETAVHSFKTRCEGFPETHVYCDDFFKHHGKYDLVLEQTFYCAIPPEMRDAYVKKLSELIVSGGEYAGVLFNFPLDQGPPYGGDAEEYQNRFSKYFDVLVLEECRNSIPPRAGRELFIRARRG